MDEVQALVAMLNPSEFDDYGNWMRLGWCLHNIDKDHLLETWVTFSSKSSKFVPGECEQLWATMRNEGLSIGSLHMWAKRDSPYEYKVLMNGRVNADIKACNGSHNAVAAIAGKLLRGRYTWVTGKVWFEFDGNLWKEDKEAIHLRHELSTTVRDQYIFTMNHVTAATMKSPDDDFDRSSEATTTASIKADKELSAKLLNIAFRLQDANYKDQRSYVLKTMARQLYGDSGNELFHIHAGFQGAAGNGKTKFFEVLELTLGDYCRKFPVQVLTAKCREEAGKPAPEYSFWRGRRVLFCTEPKDDDTLHSGIMKDLTGGEQILYRLLFSNDVHVFRPQFKMHIMCNGPPKVDGSDEGVRRRIRKVDYISRFVDTAMVNKEKHFYARDATFFERLESDEFCRVSIFHYLLEHFEKDYEFQMPDVVAKNSRIYLDDNNSVNKFVQEFITADKESYLTLADAKEAFRRCEYFNGKIVSLKGDLEKALGTACIEQKKINGRKLKNVYMGFRLVLCTDCEF
ncbi:hypothetical protein HYH03_013601 [Edaphochlamys debaryana]|uniref:Primase C-terminal 2 domain-containing protein n=1 Tax=Edaphochlamys debaryana TaxID=47281 RepID=A0A835XPP6_9CHLO|nr:hypothetical protein HYH03_013601 [Edaphochlamys debaryana]|eukprot:KAG2487756.1 hypothetical protein HYH03_013601 [Edaphochlamys debaryana]